MNSVFEKTKIPSKQWESNIIKEHAKQICANYKFSLDCSILKNPKILHMCYKDLVSVLPQLYAKCINDLPYIVIPVSLALKGKKTICLFTYIKLNTFDILYYNVNPYKLLPQYLYCEDVFEYNNVIPSKDEGSCLVKRSAGNEYYFCISPVSKEICNNIGGEFAQNYFCNPFDEIIYNNPPIKIEEKTSTIEITTILCQGNFEIKNGKIEGSCDSISTSNKEEVKKYIEGSPVTGVPTMETIINGKKYSCNIKSIKYGGYIQC